jgi:hypothetical protein
MAVLTFTVVFYLLYKYRCNFILYGWLAMSVTLLLGSRRLQTQTVIAHAVTCFNATHNQTDLH